MLARLSETIHLLLLFTRRKAKREIEAKRERERERERERNRKEREINGKREDTEYICSRTALI